MKKIINIITIVMLSSCAIQNVALDVYHEHILIERSYIYYPDDFNVDEINNYQDITNWILERVEPSLKYKDEWRSMEQSLNSGKADCKGYSVLFLGLCYIKWGYKGDIIFTDIDSFSRDIVNGGSVNHSIVRIKGEKIEPQTGKVVGDSVNYFYRFNEVFY